MTDWQTLESHCEIACPYGGWKPGAIRAEVDRIVPSSSIKISRTELGKSHEGRPIELVQLGSGKVHVLLWSQMHGNEPTHTTVLLNLLVQLANHSSETFATNLLDNLTIGMVIGLNPDGAERNIRRNAQGIDINRDALEFSTPEGRILRDLVKSYAPDYAFNLHNQRHRLSIGDPPEPATVSLLVPVIDELNTQTESTRKATQVAATFCEKVRKQCGNRISRYGVAYYARAFGEWVQRQGVPVILVEAGGWPDGRFEEVDRLHYAALAQTLEAIALGKLEEAKPESYHDLPEFHKNLLFDVLVEESKIAQPVAGTLTETEIGINFPARMAGVPSDRQGVIEDLGDLHENGGIETLSNEGAIILAGRIVVGDDDEKAAAVGATTMLFPVQLPAEPSNIAKHLEKITGESIGLNKVLVTYSDHLPEDPGECFKVLAIASVNGLAAVLMKDNNEQVSKLCEQLAILAIKAEEVPSATSPLPENFGAWASETQSVAKLLDWNDRGRIDLQLPADFAFINEVDSKLVVQKIIVGGAVAWDCGNFQRPDAGDWLF